MPGVQVPYFKGSDLKDKWATSEQGAKSDLNKGRRSKVKSFAECSVGVQRNESGAVFVVVFSK